MDFCVWCNYLFVPALFTNKHIDVLDLMLKGLSLCSYIVLFLNFSIVFSKYTFFNYHNFCKILHVHIQSIKLIRRTLVYPINASSRLTIILVIIRHENRLLVAFIWNILWYTFVKNRRWQNFKWYNFKLCIYVFSNLFL